MREKLAMAKGYSAKLQQEQYRFRKCKDNIYIKQKGTSKIQFSTTSIDDLLTLLELKSFLPLASQIIYVFHFKETPNPCLSWEVYKRDMSAESSNPF